jgi:SH3 domain-containing YSC84-like protein 1
MMVETNTSYLSFRFSELSQPIWSLLLLVAKIPKDNYMKKIMSLLLMSLIGLVGTLAWAGSAREDTVDRMQKSVDVLQAIMATPDKGIPEEVLNGAKCIVIVPDLIKGGFIFGAKHGRGVASCRTPEGWSAPAFVSVGGGSWGLQIGVEDIDLVMLVMNDRGLQHLLSSKFELTGEGSVAAGPVGRHTSAGTDILLQTEVLTYSRSRGVFAGLTLEGAVVEQDNDSTRAIYGEHMMFRNVLSGRVPTPPSGEAFVAAVSEAGHQAHIAEAK